MSTNSNIFSESKLDKLWQNVKEYRQSENFKSVMKACSRFRHLAPYNALLVEMQRPGARFVLSEFEWRKKFDRYIKPNARPIIVMIPFGPVDFLFDISDTYQQDDNYSWNTENEILRQLEAPYKTRENVTDELLNNFISRLSIQGVALDKSLIAGNAYGGNIRLLDYPESINIQVNKNMQITWKASYLISINKNAKNGESLATICHELGHLFCQHLRPPEHWKQWKIRNISHDAKEFEAESVSWLVCERLGVGNPSESYLSNYLKKNEEIPSEVSIEKILYAAKEIWNMCSLNTNITYRDGLLYKYCDEFKQTVQRVQNNSKK